ncbi:MAG: hypothetical protein DRG82_11040 [Deltaproteobacteria bacterium]|nr:MAG: hypothetical protein DRG82_11040 [Deltaproteobacteria bacterium]
MNKKKIILSFLVIIFAASLAYRLTHPYHQQKVQRLTYSGSRKRVIVKKDTGKSGDEVLKCPEVLLGLYAKRPRHHGEVIHDPFFLPEEKASGVKEPPVAQAKPPEGAVKPAEEDPRARAQRELSGFRVFGSCQEGETTMLFLERGKDIFIVRPGDKIDGKYLVKSINGHSLDLWAEEIQENIHIDLSNF